MFFSAFSPSAGLGVVRVAVMTSMWTRVSDAASSAAPLKTNPWLSELPDPPNRVFLFVFALLIFVLGFEVDARVHYRFRGMIWVPRGVMARTLDAILWWYPDWWRSRCQLILETPHIFTNFVLLSCFWDLNDAKLRKGNRPLRRPCQFFHIDRKIW